MYKNHYFILLVLFCNSVLFSQNNVTIIKGITVDSLNQALPFSHIVLLEAKDSIINQYTTSDEEGKFQLKKVKKGSYILNASYVGYEVFGKHISVLTNNNIDIGAVILRPKITQLTEVVVAAEMIPISVKGDTIEYNALAFKTRANANVEDLLKRLPGIEVDRNGGIKAQGQPIHKVMVNGKDFFGNDPKIATQNLMAEGIHKVQVFYKNSDMSEFTGIDDGSGQITINLKLKRDRLKGYFGTVMGGYGTDKRNRGQFNINRFTDKIQLSFIGMVNNINKGGYSSIKNLQNQALGNGLNEGIVTTKASGINFNKEFGDKTDWRSSYFYSNIGQSIHKNTFRQSISGTESYNSNSNSIVSTRDNSHNFNGKLTQKFNTTNELLWTGKIKASNNLNNNQSDISRMGDVLTEQNSQNVSTTDLAASEINSDLLYRHRFKKRGKFAVANFKLSHVGNASNFELNTSTDLLTNVENNVTQFQEHEIGITNLISEVSFVNPVGIKGNKHIEINYETGVKKRSIDNSFETDTTNMNFNKFRSNYSYQQPSIKFKFFDDTFLFATGAAMHFSSLSNLKPSLEIQKERDFQYLIPHLFFRYKMGKETQLIASYNSSVKEPNIVFMQPISYDIDQFNGFTGNPNLKPEHIHESSLSFKTYSQFSFRSFSFSTGINKINDKITRAVATDNMLFRNTSWVNSDSETTTFLNTNFSSPLNFMESKINVGLYLSKTNNTVSINQLADKVNWKNSQFNFSIENKRKNSVDVLAGFRLTKNSSNYLKNKMLNNDFLRKSFYGDLTLYLKTWEIYSSMNYALFEQGKKQSIDRIPLWTASISKSFLKNEKGQLSLAVLDALNVNKNFSQISTLNYIQSEQTNALERYVMLSFSYKLSKFN